MDYISEEIDLCPGHYFVSNIEDCIGVFKRLLAGHAYFQPCDIARIENHKFEHIELFLRESYKKVYDRLNGVFISALGEKILSN